MGSALNRRATTNRRASQCINAKAETLEQRATFREAFQQRRCVIPADGFYEWTGPKGILEPPEVFWVGLRPYRELFALHIVPAFPGGLAESRR